MEKTRVSVQGCYPLMNANERKETRMKSVDQVRVSRRPHGSKTLLSIGVFCVHWRKKPFGIFLFNKTAFHLC